MIVRTYQRRNRGSRSLSEGGSAFGDGVGTSGSQESIWGSSSEPPPFSFPSSQESCWSQSDHGSRSRLHTSTSRFSQDDDLGGDTLSAFSSRPPLVRSFSERPKKNDDGKPSRSKLKKIQSDVPGLFLSESKNGSSRGAERRRSDLHGRDGQENGGGSSSGKRESVWVDALNNASMWGHSAPPTSTLMEAQESGEMMEHVDEANFALDGLKPEQPVRVQRASLTSLLSLCGSMHQRRLLRTQGMAKPLVDAIVALPTDDAALSLAAAAVLYFLASDSQDEDLLDSPACVRFLMKLLGTSPSEPVVKKGLSVIGSRLAALSKSSLQKSHTSLSADRGGAAVVTKIRALFKSLPENGAGLVNLNEENGMLPGEEINSKWLALLTLEKACLSTVILEDSNAENVRKVGGQFKERLRELGGLDAICELAAGCLVNLTEALKAKDAETLKHVDLVALEKTEKSGGVGVLLRCLRVMENVTFLSEQNQKHLLELKLPKEETNRAESFIGLTLNVINTLSELYQRQKQPEQLDLTSYPETDVSGAGKSPDQTGGIESLSASKGFNQNLVLEMSVSRDTSSCLDRKENTLRLQPSASSKNTSSMITFQRRKSLKVSSSSLQVLDDSEKSQATSSVAMDCRGEQSQDPTAMGSVDRSIEKAPKNFYKRKGSQSQSEIHQESVSAIQKTEISMQSDVSTGLKGRHARNRGGSLHEDSQDPFAFDDFQNIITGDQKRKSSGFEDSQDPFALDDTHIALDGKKDAKKKPRRGQAAKPVAQVKKRNSGILSLTPVDNGGRIEASRHKEMDEKIAMITYQAEDGGNRLEAVIGDCLLSGVKVLMNLTNNNSAGCQQVAAFGGLKTLSSLLIAHYPWPKAPVLGSDGKDVPAGEGGPTKEADHDLDIVVTVLGVLCNLVERDTCNRTRLASLKVQVPPNIAKTKEGELWQESGMVALLCSLFLTKQGAGEAAAVAENKRILEMDEDATVKQGQAEAEDMIVEAYTALLLAFLSKESEKSRTAIAQLLPEDDLKVLVPVLERFVAFHLQLNMLAPETHAVVRDVIDSCKQPLANRPTT